MPNPLSATDSTPHPTDLRLAASPSEPALTERQRAQLLLEQQAKILELGRDASLIRRFDGSIAFWNQGAERLYGFSRQFALGKIAHDLLQTVFPKSLESMTDDLELRGYWEGELIHHTHTGQEVTVLSRWTLQRDAAGRPLAILETNTDISDRKAAELALRQSETRLRDLINSNSDWIWEVDPDGKFIYVSDQVVTLLGYEPPDVLGKTLFEFMPPPEAQRLRRRFGEIVASQQPFRGLEHRSQRKDGREIVLEINGVPMFDPEGRFCGYRGIERDISDRKAAEVALYQTAQREKLLNRLTRQIHNSLDFETIVANAVEEIREFLQIDRCHFAWYHAEVAEPYWQVVREVRIDAKLPDFTGSYPATLFGPLNDPVLRQEKIHLDDVDNVEPAEIRKFLRSLGNRSMLILPIQSKFKGSIGIIACIQSYSVRPWQPTEIEILDLVVEQLGIALNQADLFERSQTKAHELQAALQQLQQTQLQMIQSEKMSSLGQMVAGVAHEINNPVNFINGNLDHVARYTQDLLGLLALYQREYPQPSAAIVEEIEAIDLEFLTDDLDKALKSMQIGAERIREIVLSLRNFSRLDEAEVKNVDLHEGLESTLTILHSRLKSNSRRSAIKLHKSYGPLPPIECYAGQLNQVFMNLLANAIDAIDDPWATFPPDLEPEIHIHTTVLAAQDWPAAARADRSAGWVQITIGDNGPGIPPAVQAKLFDPFFTTKPVGKGTGLGLSISYQIVAEKHGGELLCRSRPGQGTEFCVKIPVRRSDAIVPATSAN